LVKVLNALDKLMLEKVADLHEIPQGAFNIRKNGAGVQRNTTENIDIITKADKSGIDVIIKPHTKGESVHIPVIVTEENINDVVYNTFEVGEYSDVLIVRVGRSEYMALMGKVGVDVILSPRLLTAGVILRQVRQGEVVSVSLLEGAKAEAMEIVISAKSSIIGRKLKDAKIPDNILIGALVRGDDLIIPDGNTMLQPGDRIVIFTLPNLVKKISKIF